MRFAVVLVLLLSLLAPIARPVAAQQAPPPICDPVSAGLYVLAYPCEPPPDCGGLWDMILHPIQYLDCRDYRESWLESHIHVEYDPR